MSINAPDWLVSPHRNRDTLNAAKSATDILWDGSDGQVLLSNCWIGVMQMCIFFVLYLFSSFRFHFVFGCVGLSFGWLLLLWSWFLCLFVCLFCVCPMPFTSHRCIHTLHTNTNYHQQLHKLVHLFTSSHPQLLRELEPHPGMNQKPPIRRY